MKQSVICPEPGTRIGYVTDIEGNFDYWQRYLKISNVLKINATTNQGPSLAQSSSLLTTTSLNIADVELMENCHLVFGGDVCDRGFGDLRVTRDLLFLAQRYPDRVHLILGNRDINKLRLGIELRPDALSHPARVYWVDQPSNDSGGQSAVDRLKWVLDTSFSC